MFEHRKEKLRFQKQKKKVKISLFIFVRTTRAHIHNTVFLVMTTTTIHTTTMILTATFSSAAGGGGGGARGGKGGIGGQKRVHHHRQKSFEVRATSSSSTSTSSSSSISSSSNTILSNTPNGVLFSSNSSKNHNDYSIALDKLRASGCEVYDVGSRFLSKGDRGEDVKALQALLMSEGLLSKDVAPTGIFDEGTKTALQSWQARRCLPNHGAFGDLCRLAYLDEKRLEMKSLLSSPLPPDRRKWKEAAVYQPQPMPKRAKSGGIMSLNSPMSWVQVTIGALVGATILSAASVLPNIDMDEIANRPDELTDEEEAYAMKILNGVPKKKVGEEKGEKDDE